MPAYIMNRRMLDLAWRSEEMICDSRVFIVNIKNIKIAKQRVRRAIVVVKMLGDYEALS